MTNRSDSKGQPKDAGPGMRLHPMTLAHRALVSIPALIFILLPIFRSGDTTAWLNLVMASVYGALVLPWMVIHYLRFRYWITPNEIIIHSGVLTRRRRNIPIDRIQTVDIERQMLHRLTGTSRVRIHTAGSTKAEGSLDVVSAAQAKRFRETVRALQRGEESGLPLVAGWTSSTDDPESIPDSEIDHQSDFMGNAGLSRFAEPEKDEQSSSDTYPGHDDESLQIPTGGPPSAPVFELSMQRAWLSGVFHFSLLYLALAFSALQYIDPNPEFLVRLIERASGVDALRESPWTAGIMAAVGAVLLGWASGILTSVNRNWGFRLERGDGRLYRRQGLLSIREGTIPLRKVQALVIRTNPLMRRFGWYALDAQTMGIDVGESGHAVVVPFGRREEIERAASIIMEGMAVRDRELVRMPLSYESVSPLTIRRALVRYLGLLVILTLTVSWFWEWGWWLFLLAPGLIAGAFLRFRHMGFALTDSRLWVRSGVFRQHQWLLPLSRLQVLHRRASLFQRRLHLATLYVDTAGASPVRGPDIVDVPAEEADRLSNRVYAYFKALTA